MPRRSRICRPLPLWTSLLGVALLAACSRTPAGPPTAGPGEEAAPAAVRQAAAGPQPDILLIVVDTMRADRFGLNGAKRSTTPELDARFRDGLVFENARATVPFTAPSVMSLLTGLYPEHHRVRMIFQLLAPEFPTLPDWLSHAGYRTSAIVSNMVLTDEATGLGSRFGYYDDYVDEAVRWAGAKKLPDFERDARRTTDAALEWLARAAAHPGPRFVWLHYMDPHAPYTPPAEFAKSFRHERPQRVDPATIADSARVDGLDDELEYVDRYDGEVAFADHEVARFLDAYDQLLGLDHAVVVLASDHGETLTEPGRERLFGHGFDVWREQLHVVLALRGPGIPAGRRSDPVSLLDVAPTLLGLAGAPPVQGLDGRSLLAPPEPQRELLAEGAGPHRGFQYRALIRGDEKWVMYSENGVELPDRRHRIDLADDPLETHPLPWEPGGAPPNLLAAFRADPDPSGLPLKESILVGRPLQNAKVKPQGLPVVSDRADAETRAKLKALGYL